MAKADYEESLKLLKKVQMETHMLLEVQILDKIGSLQNMNSLSDIVTEFGVNNPMTKFYEVNIRTTVLSVIESLIVLKESMTAEQKERVTTYLQNMVEKLRQGPFDDLAESIEKGLKEISESR